MQGYIININRARDEDLIVTILTPQKLKTTYRFYGARHSTINLGYKIDFEPQHSIKSNIPQLRDVLHLAYKWNVSRDRMYLWQSFISLFYPHLKDIEEIDSFYFDLLEECAIKWQKQNPKRIAIEAYTKLLAHEGRLHVKSHCFFCDSAISGNIALARGFLPAHAECIFSEGFDPLHVKHLMKEKSTLVLDDDKIEILWKLLLEGF